MEKKQAAEKVELMAILQVAQKAALKVTYSVVWTVALKDFAVAVKMVDLMGSSYIDTLASAMVDGKVV